MKHLLVKLACMLLSVMLLLNVGYAESIFPKQEVLDEDVSVDYQMIYFAGVAAYCAINVVKPIMYDVDLVIKKTYQQITEEVEAEADFSWIWRSDDTEPEYYVEIVYTFGRSAKIVVMSKTFRLQDKEDILQDMYMTNGVVWG